MAKLVALTEGFTGRSCELRVEPTTVGRLEDNAFQLAEPSVSGHHCELFLRGSDVVVKDLNSTNGTFISDEKITEAVLKQGQILRLGQVELRLDDGTPVTPTKRTLDRTTRMPQGVKLDSLETSTRPLSLSPDSGFKKKSNKINLVFMAVGIGLGVIVILLLVFALTRGGGGQ